MDSFASHSSPGFYWLGIETARQTEARQGSFQVAYFKPKGCVFQATERAVYTQLLTITVSDTRASIMDAHYEKCCTFASKVTQITFLVFPLLSLLIVNSRTQSFESLCQGESAYKFTCPYTPCTRSYQGYYLLPNFFFNSHKMVFSNCVTFSRKGAIHESHHIPVNVTSIEDHVRQRCCILSYNTN